MKNFNTKEIEQTKKNINKRLEKWKKMCDGDINALCECMYINKMCNKGDFYEYKKSKKS